MGVSLTIRSRVSGVSTTLAVLTLSSFAASAVFLAKSFSKIEQDAYLQQVWNKIIEKHGHYMDVARGLLVLSCSPIYLAYFCTSFVKQQLRNIACLKYKRPANDSKSVRNIEGKGWVTLEARRLIREYRSWDRTAVLTYAIYWGIGFMSLSVFVSKFTTLFLSWLIEQTSNMELIPVTAILFIVGTIMFLLPPIPGGPVYICLGIVIIPVGEKTLGIVLSSIYAMIVSLILKLFATFLQQKMIGEMLRDYVVVRQMVGINSKLIRSMKLILSSPGLSIAKVAILCGGPDWPTSVLCGIMGLDLRPILIGTLPTAALVVPTVLTGSFTYMGSLGDDGDLDYPWAETAKAICAAMAAVVLFTNMSLAAVYVEETYRNRKEELEALPIDLEVKAADDESEKVSGAYADVTKWHCMPLWSRATLYTSTLCVIICCWLVQMFPGYCFVKYELTDTISDDLDGDWKNFFKPLGLVSIALFVVSACLLHVFSSWATKEAKEMLLSPATKESIARREGRQDSETSSSPYITFREDVYETPPDRVLPKRGLI